jgi:hypothetical protein
VSLNQSQHRWGVGDVMSVDGVTVGAFGKLFLQIADATKFVTQLVAGEQMYTEANIESWVGSLVTGIMRTELAARDIRSLMSERDAFVQACQAKLADMFAQWGFTFKHLEVMGFNVPPEYRTAVQNVTLAGFKQQSALIEAQTRAQALQIEAQAQSNARLMTGTADVQIMALMQQQGMDPVKIQMVKALMEYAQTPSEGGGGGLISGDLYKPQVFAMLTQLLVDPVVPNDVKQTLRQNFPQQSAMVPQPIVPPTIAAPAAPQPAATEPALTAAKVQETLDNLDMQLAEGKISEATYDRLREKWEAKLKTL